MGAVLVDKYQNGKLKPAWEHALYAVYEMFSACENIFVPLATIHQIWIKQSIQCKKKTPTMSISTAHAFKVRQYWFTNISCLREPTTNQSAFPQANNILESIFLIVQVPVAVLF